MRLKQISIRMSEKIYEQIEELAMLQGISISAAVRAILIDWFDEYEADSLFLKRAIEKKIADESISDRLFDEYKMAIGNCVHFPLIKKRMGSKR